MEAWAEKFGSLRWVSLAIPCANYALEYRCLNCFDLDCMKTPITEISGIGPATADALVACGFASVEAIAASDVASLCVVPGFGLARAQRVIAAAKALKAAAKPEPKAKAASAPVKSSEAKVDKLKTKKSKKVKKAKKSESKKDKVSKKGKKSSGKVEKGKGKKVKGKKGKKGKKRSKKG